ncbi:hypothetical protein FA10DRAFT_272832 [Acaromyces ingoldii]|uniref:MARVEL domain-containing protein n=1 Tax=Acaromyces ingoldii TaxID=215250 RepID=A0A316YH17_9BASI|nr:hypothetical protein FA10DRAFT_272832 [Acaromyces ingoldii]PWN88441.1 hypothetical protein FA10DRAFT_272832 [Acaromyces ingoldii]
MGLPQRHSATVPAAPRTGGPPAINPNLVLAVRFLLTALVCGLGLIAAIISILVVQYYNTHDPIIRPSWGSLIYVIVLGLFTPIIYFGYNILLPIAPFINYGDFLYSLFMAKIELLLQFSFCVLWVSAALAYANDLHGYENCTFDGYFHYPKPADFNHVCDLTNLVVPFNYAAFGVQTLLFVFEALFGLYTFLYLDQESINEPHFAWGRRAYDYRLGANQSGAAGRGNAYRARATESEGGHRRSGRRGAEYADPERGSEEMAESAADSRPASLGARGRGRRGYGEGDEEEEERYGDGAPVTEHGQAYDGIDDGHTDEGWHLREESGAARA